MPRNIFLCAAILFLGLFSSYCLRFHSHQIQQDISDRVSAVLAANRIASQGLLIDGRDVVLSGPPGSPQISAAMQKLVAAVDGVRTVNVRQTGGIDSLPDARSIVTKPEVQRNLDALLAQYIVEFNPASAQLTPRGRGILDQVAPLLTASPASFCEIQGHTDSQGEPAANEALSLRRALATKDYLIEKGIAPERLLPKGFGDTRPVASNDTPHGRQLNRRIDFLLKENP
jgi:outer membrane protein OmpA-like peptidoglycan-associated protein